MPASLQKGYRSFDNEKPSAETAEAANVLLDALGLSNCDVRKVAFCSRIDGADCSKNVSPRYSYG